jgi:hypothetical protein
MLRRVNRALLIGLTILSGLLIIPATHAAKIEDFIPDDSIVYLAFRDLDEVWRSVEESENWKGVLEAPRMASKMDEVNQGLNLIQLMLGVEPSKLVEMFGRNAAFALLSGKSDVVAGVIIHTGGAIGEFERIINGLTQLASGNQQGKAVKQNTGQYRKVNFTSITLDKLSLTYGFVEDFLVVGANPGGFEALIDTYKKQRQSMAQNKQFSQVHKQFETAQVFAYTNMDAALPLMTKDMDAKKLREFRALGLDSLQTLAYSLDVLNIGGGLQMYAQIKPEGRNGLLGVFLQEGQPLQSIQALSGKEDVFLSISPSSADAIWRFIETVGTASDDSGGFHSGIAQVEAFLNVNIKNDVIGALTGEIAVWGNFTELMQEGIHSPVDLLYAIDAAIVGGLKYEAKWRAFLDSIQNLANMPIQQYDYKGTTLHQLSFPPDDPTVTVRYGYLKNLFLVSFSDERFETIVDNAQKGAAVPAFKKTFKRFAANPVIFLQLKPEKLLPVVMKAGKLSADATRRLEAVGPVVGSIAVKGNEAWLRLETLSDEAAIEACGRIASALAGTVR